MATYDYTCPHKHYYHDDDYPTYDNKPKETKPYPNKSSKILNQSSEDLLDALIKNKYPEKRNAIIAELARRAKENGDGDPTADLQAYTGPGSQNNPERIQQLRDQFRTYDNEDSETEYDDESPGALFDKLSKGGISDGERNRIIAKLAQIAKDHGRGDPTADLQYLTGPTAHNDPYRLQQLYNQFHSYDDEYEKDYGV